MNIFNVFLNFYLEFNISVPLWIKHEECFRLSTSKLGIGAVVLEITL